MLGKAKPDMEHLSVQWRLLYLITNERSSYLERSEGLNAALLIKEGSDFR
jgi:hypothetical protein